VARCTITPTHASTGACCGVWMRCFAMFLHSSPLLPPMAPCTRDESHCPAQLAARMPALSYTGQYLSPPKPLTKRCCSASERHLGVWRTPNPSFLQLFQFFWCIHQSCEWPHQGSGIMATPRSITVVHAGLSGAFDKTFPQISSSGTHDHQGMPSQPSFLQLFHISVSLRTEHAWGTGR
jgi:hypothetical protein